MRLGFIGTGAITAAIVEGLGAAPGDERILLSPRSAAVAADLAARFPAVSVAASNQEVLDGSDMVMLAVRPQIAREVLSALRFRPDHHVVSLVAVLSLEQIAALAHPATKIARATPTPAVARRKGATALHPPDALVAALFDRLGTTVAVEDIAAFDALSAATATAATYFGLAEAIADWLAAHGIAGPNARSYVASLFEGLSDAAVAAPEATFAALAADHATRGGLNEQLLGHLRDRGVFAELSRGLDQILARIEANQS